MYLVDISSLQLGENAVDHNQKTIHNYIHEVIKKTYIKAERDYLLHNAIWLPDLRFSKNTYWRAYSPIQVSYGNGNFWPLSKIDLKYKRYGKSKIKFKSARGEHYSEKYKFSPSGNLLALSNGYSKAATSPRFKGVVWTSE